MDIYVNCPDKQLLSFTIKPNDRTKKLKLILEKKYGFPRSICKLCGTRELQDELTFNDYSIVQNTQLTLVLHKSRRINDIERSDVSKYM